MIVMPKAGDIRYCDLLGGRESNAAFVYIPPSAFWMGDASEKDNPVHLVGVSKGFWIQQTPLTDEQYQHLTNINTPGFTNPKNPKTKLSWIKVVSFISNKSLRMPAEAEWEMAARAGVGHKYLWSGSNVDDNVAWTGQNQDYQRKPVSLLKSNNFGLYDLSGNVFEFCSDANVELDSTPQLDPQGAIHGSLRVLRGGSFLTFSPLNTQVASRATEPPHKSQNNFGVRLIWEI